jgi:hypothetical protein
LVVTPLEIADWLVCNNRTLLLISLHSIYTICMCIYPTQGITIKNGDGRGQEEGFITAIATDVKKRHTL